MPRDRDDDHAPRSRAHRSEAASSASHAARHQARIDFTSYINSTVLDALQKSIQSASAHQSQRKKLLSLLIPALGTASDGVTQYPGFDGAEIKDATLTSLRDVVLNRLPIPTSSDSLKRFTQFLFELCKSYGRETKAVGGTYLDDVPATIIESLVNYHNAKDKQVRLMVCTLIQALLVTLTEQVPREALYAALTNALKDRCFDKCPLVREKAISALKAFHLGEKEDDVTQCSIALMCEDVNPKVREAAILSVAAYRSVHLRHIIRMTKDINSSVRRACWTALAGYRFQDQLLGYCVQLGIDLFDVCAGGLKDPSEPVRDACRSTLSFSWLNNKDVFDGNLSAMVNAFFKIPAIISIPSATLVISYLLTATKNKWKPFSLSVNPLTPANAMLWKCSVMHFVSGPGANSGNRNNNQQGDEDGMGAHHGSPQHNGNGGDNDGEVVGQPNVHGLTLSPEDDINGLPHLAKFRIIVTAVVNQYAGKAPPPPTASDTRASGLNTTTLQIEDVKVPPSPFNNPDNNRDVAFVVDLLLSVFDIYEDLGLLGHADDNGRQQMMRPLGFLLKVVTIENPICFVDASVKAIKSISERHQGEGRQLIESSLRMLFSLLSIPKQYQLSYEDVEAYARVDFDRRRRITVLEHQRLQDGEELQADSEEERLLDDISTDDAVMLRMCRIVHAYLSCVLRGTDIPAFVTHIIQLGRQQRNTDAQSLAMQCLSLQCLINPKTVTTFLPIFMNQSSDAGTVEVAVAAASGLFDMMAEYGPKFFDNNGTGPSNNASSPIGNNGAVSPAADGLVTQNNNTQNTEANRLEIERLAAEDDSYKPGSQVIVKQMMGFLQSESAQLRHLAMFGFCKLLAANRLLNEAAVPVIARLLHYYVCFEAAAVDDKEELQMHRLVEDFFRSFAFSHPRRQVQVLEAGLLALRLVLNEHIALNGPQSAEIPKIATKILKRTINLTDAINVQQVRDVDPDLSAQVAHQSALEASRISGVNNDAALEDSILSRSAGGGNSNNKTAANRTVTIRLWRELGRCSLHERLSLELLADASQFRDNDAIMRLLLQELPVLRLYKRDVMLYECIKQHGDDCKKLIRNGPSNQSDVFVGMIDLFVQGCEKIKAASLDDTLSGGGADGGFNFNTSAAMLGANNGFAFTAAPIGALPGGGFASGASPRGTMTYNGDAASPSNNSNGGNTPLEAAYGGSLAYRAHGRRQLSEAVNKFLVPIHDQHQSQQQRRGGAQTQTSSSSAATHGWIPRSELPSVAAATGARGGAASKSASRATTAAGSVAASSQRSSGGSGTYVNEDYADIVRGVVKKKRK